MGEVGGSGPRFLNLSTNWRSQLNYGAALSLGKEPSVLVAKKPAWEPGSFFLLWRREDCLLLLVIETQFLGRPCRNLGLTPTEQSQIVYVRR
jgi:hypothetical protein